MKSAATFQLDRTRLAILGFVALVLAGTWLMALPATPGSMESSIFRFFNDFPDWLKTPTWAWMQLGALAFVPLAAIGAHALWQRFTTTAAVFGAGVAAWLAALAVKTIVARGRPADLLDAVNMRSDTTGYGYVSGHTAVAFALATVASRNFGPIGKIALYALASGVGVLRLYVGAHFPLDVVGGAALGILVGYAISVFSGERDDHALRH